MTIAVIIGPLFDMGYCRALVTAGAVFEIVGFMLTSISTTYWQILLAQGVCVGLGTCCLSIPSMAIVPLYFFKRRALAMATATVGSGLGSALYPLIFRRLLRQVGFGWTMRTMGFLSFAMCLFALAVLRPRKSPEKPAWKTGGFSWRWFIDLSAFKEPSYIIYSVAIFFNNLAFFIPSYHLQSYAFANGMRGVELASYLLTIMNAASIPGRIIPSYVADKVGSLDTYVVVCTLSSATIFYWISVSSTTGNVAFAVMWGLFSGGAVALANVVLTGITPDLTRLGTRLGMVSIIKGVGSLIGPPTSGAILGGTSKYLGVQLFSAIGMMLTAVLMLALRLDLARRAMLSNCDREQEKRGEGVSQG
jgi:MFS family permease